MNKQEVMRKMYEAGFNCKAIKYASQFDKGYNNGIAYAINLLDKLDEPEKPIVPQFVADWYEDNKDDFEDKLLDCGDVYCIQDTDFGKWLLDSNNKSIQTLVAMHFFGYGVEKEKLYMVVIPNPNSIGGKLVLFKQQSTGRLILDMLNPNINKPKYLHLTEPEIKQDFDWAWQFAKEVEE